MRIQALLEEANPPLSEVMTKDPYLVPIGTPLSQVAKEMAKHKYGCAIVVNDKTGIIGIFTTVDGMRILSAILEAGITERAKLEDSPIEKYFEWFKDSECL